MSVARPGLQHHAGVEVFGPRLAAAFELMQLRVLRYMDPLHRGAASQETAALNRQKQRRADRLGRKAVQPLKLLCGWSVRSRGRHRRGCGQWYA